ncbi:TOPRIM domain protein [Desulfofarcimen acetoxidans DSM 771]|uniref:TOPRIM domain protein n=1 Tax=Desulfofarcimen acetoxidans (strain ATCC 49208 / DSM 771 / KCTC 5769 / VKM B-1644 / 5575) TaxID=485916 RepID=C8W0L1_DESAS|nr:DUF3854 domain-containing protein [Desulfofarcimen acetoxidans]ACV63266.1 TOPRIM domain protein [Desulfofarcimen acetoxidans DSM 771]
MKFVRVNRHRLCPVCGRSDWCAFNSTIAICMRVESNKPIKNGGWLHKLSEPMLSVVQYTETVETAVIAAPLEVRNEVYKAFLELLTLSPEHKNELQRRGMAEEQIIEFRSVPKVEKPWTICQKLIEQGFELSGIPGFYRAPNRHGGYYWTFKMKTGFIIPIKDKTKKIQALQVRLDQPDSKGKYRLFSSSNKKAGSCSGVPVHVAIPQRINDRRIWITEGPIKAAIASQYLGAVVLGLIGATTWRPVLEILRSKRPEVILAFDRDQTVNIWVGRAVIELTKELIDMGIKVKQASWNNIFGNGLDEALVNSTEIKINEV